MQLKGSLAQETAPVRRPDADTQLKVDPTRLQAGARGVSGIRPRIAAPPATLGDASVADGATVAISYLESSPVRVQGLATGRTYEFSATRASQLVDPRDAGALLNTGLFRRV
jgi:hypothetical protein